MAQEYALSDLECSTCRAEIENIVDLLQHDCDKILSAEDLSQSERSTLMYIESQIVDGGAKIDDIKMNMEDDSNIKLFRAAGLLDVEHLDNLPMESVQFEVTKFTDEAWELAAECRKLRGNL